MEWTKIPTDLLQSRKSDKEIIAITKYQLLWAMLERKPDNDVALRYMTSKQLQQVNDFMTAIERCVNADIKSVENTRKRQKVFYDKNQTLADDSNGRTNANTNGRTNHKTNDTDKIREDKIRLDYKKEEKPSGYPSAKPSANPNAKPSENLAENENINVIINKLKDIIDNHYNRNFETRNWNKDIGLLISKDGISFDRIIKALDWYKFNIGGKYIPVIQSAGSLREKFMKLEDAISRNTSNTFNIKRLPDPEPAELE